MVALRTDWITERNSLISRCLDDAISGRWRESSILCQVAALVARD